MKKAFNPLKPANLNPLQEKFRGCKFLIIDEKSIISLQQLSWIDKRCREIFPRRADEYFNNLNVILYNDFF